MPLSEDGDAVAIRVLVVDDDAMQLELIDRALSRDGFAIEKVMALADVAPVAQRFAPELVLVDVNMPDAPVERVVALARGAAPAAKIFLHSAWEASKLRLVAAQVGADGFVSKGDSVFELGGRLRELRAKP